MAFVIALTQPRYHHSTDALIGSSTSILTDHYGTFETFQWADAKAELLAREVDYDGDLHFTVRDTADLRRPLYSDPAAPLPQQTLTQAEIDDDIPF